MATSAIHHLTTETRGLLATIAPPPTVPEPFPSYKREEILFRELSQKINENPPIQPIQIASYTKPLKLSMIKRLSSDDVINVELIKSWKRKKELSDLISQIRDLTEARHAERIALRLDYLRNNFAEDEAGERDISADSLRDFIKFLNLHPNIRYPEITLTPSGNVYIRWKGEHKSLFSILFLSSQNVQFVVFAPNERHPEIINHISGTETVDTVLEKLDKAYGVASWVTE